MYIDISEVFGVLYYDINPEFFSENYETLSGFDLNYYKKTGKSYLFNEIPSVSSTLFELTSGFIWSISQNYFNFSDKFPNIYEDNKFLNLLKKDTDLLANYNLNDYSLLFGI